MDKYFAQVVVPDQKVLVQKQIRTFATILPLISAPKVQSYK